LWGIRVLTENVEIYALLIETEVSINVEQEIETEIPDINQ